MRTPNTQCQICKKPLYRRPSDLARYKSVCCADCRSELYKQRPPSSNLKLGREKGTNHLEGISKSEKHKQKMKKIMSKWCKDNFDKVRKRGEKTRGEKHYRWKGGTTKLNISIRRMTENRKWMDAVKARDKKCKHCGGVEELESHHIIPLAMLLEKHNITNRDEARECKELWNIKNGITLCRKCHYKLDNRKYYDTNK
jgi:hypothetical protein